MRMTMRVAAAAGVVAIGAVAACGGSGGTSGHNSGAPLARAHGSAVLTGHVEQLHAGSLTAAQVGADETEFGFALFHRLCTAAPAANLTISPASAAEALGMLDAGSVGSTRTALASLLKLPVWSPALVAALSQQSAALAKVKQVTVSNHIFAQTGVHPSRQTLDDLVTAYSTDLHEVDFGSEPSTTKAINTVISHDTDGLIPTLFSPALDPSTQMVLANAILLDAKWAQAFPASSPGSFTTAVGRSVSATLMDNSEGEFAARSADGWQSVVLPYVGNLQAVAILPPQHPGATNSSGGTEPVSEAACTTPSTSTLTALTSGPSQGDGVVLPKLNLSQTEDLTKTLASMGLPLGGNYAGLGGDLQVSDVVQKVVMKVDEKGTKAAASTGVAMAAAARVASQVVTFNRPFLLLLEDTTTHTPLFLTKVNDPTQE